MSVKITYDPVKRQKTLEERGLDFARAPEVFAKKHTVEAIEMHGEKRFFTMGVLDSRVVVIVWMWRDGDRRIISMRKANDKEQRRYQIHVG